MLKPNLHCSALLCYGSGPYSEVVMSARNLCRGVSLVTALTVLLGIGVAAEARDLRGAWVTDKSTCKKVFTGEGPNLESRKMQMSTAVVSSTRATG